MKYLCLYFGNLASKEKFLVVRVETESILGSAKYHRQERIYSLLAFEREFGSSQDYRERGSHLHSADIGDRVKKKTKKRKIIKT